MPTERPQGSRDGPLQSPTRTYKDQATAQQAFQAADDWGGVTAPVLAKAEKATILARIIYPNNEKVENQALEFMDMPEDQLDATLDVVEKNWDRK